MAGWLLHHPGRQSHLPLQRQHVIRGPPRAAGSVPEGRHVVARPPQVLRYVCLRTTRSLPNDARRRLLHLGQRQPPPCESILHDVHNHICLDCRIRIHIYIYLHLELASRGWKVRCVRVDSLDSEDMLSLCVGLDAQLHEVFSSLARRSGPWSPQGSPAGRLVE